MSTPPPSATTLQGLRLRENHLFFALTVVVGVIAGLSAVLFALAIDGAGRTFFGFDPTPARLFLIPTAASLLAGILLSKVFPDVRALGPLLSCDEGATVVWWYRGHCCVVV